MNTAQRRRNHGGAGGASPPRKFDQGGWDIYTYKRAVCVCLSVGLSAFYRPHDISYFAALPPSPKAGAVAGRCPMPDHPPCQIIPHPLARSASALGSRKIFYDSLFSTLRLAALIEWETEIWQAGEAVFII